MENQEFKNKDITPRDVDFAQWYTDVVKKAELMDYSDVKGFIIYRPYGYAIWEEIQAYNSAEHTESNIINNEIPAEKASILVAIAKTQSSFKSSFSLLAFSNPSLFFVSS